MALTLHMGTDSYGTNSGGSSVYPSPFPPRTSVSPDADEPTPLIAAWLISFAGLSLAEKPGLRARPAMATPASWHDQRQWERKVTVQVRMTNTYDV